MLEVQEEIDVAVFAIPAKFCAAAMEEVGRKKIPGAVMIPSGFAEVGEQALQDELVGVARKHNVRVMGPNIYGFYYTPQNLCATFCTPYDVKGKSRSARSPAASACRSSAFRAPRRWAFRRSSALATNRISMKTIS